MQSVHRHFGKYMKRSADESHVSLLLKDFDDADKMLTRVSSCYLISRLYMAWLIGAWQIIDASKAWRDSWISILTYQHRLVAEFEGLYAPIIGASSDYQGHQPVETPEATMSRTARLREEYEDLKRDLLDEVNLVDARMVKPATEAHEHLQPMKKTIKKREDRKVSQRAAWTTSPCYVLLRSLTCALRPDWQHHSSIMKDTKAE